MKLLSRLLIILGFASSAVLADECTRISDLNSIYRSIIESTASELSVKRLQQIVGVTADGVWGPRSELAFNNLISKCNSYSYPGLSIIINEAKVIDFYKRKTVFEQIPYEFCTNQKTPVFGVVQNRPNTGAVLGGAVLGGIIGKTVTKKDGGAAVGAIIGGAIANENQKSNTSTGIIGYENTRVCETKFKNSPREEVVYSYSTLTFDLDGQEQTIEFQKIE
jgi:uncharacterized protein YcfJ